jgi:hypothetical protein
MPRMLNFLKPIKVLAGILRKNSFFATVEDCLNRLS